MQWHCNILVLVLLVKDSAHDTTTSSFKALAYSILDWEPRDKKKAQACAVVTPPNTLSYHRQV